MRRGSLFGPLLLIGLGVLFLARNIYPDLRLMDYLAKYWPFLLVFWGVLRLGEILYWAATDQPLPQRGVSGGEWIMVVLLCFVGATLHAAQGFSTWFPGTIELGGLDMFGETYEYPLSAEKPASKTPHIVIESFRGNARITGTDTDVVKVTGRKTIRSMDKGAADRANQEAGFEILGDSNQVIIRTNQDRVVRPRRITAEMEITVPKGASVEAHGRYGDFDITNLDGAVDISSENAGVRLENIAGATRLDLRRSDIVRAVNLKAAFELKGSGTDIELENMDGEVSINGSYTGNVQFRNVSKPLHFTGPQTEFSAEKIPGQVRMPLGNFNAAKLAGPAHLNTRNRDVQISDFTNALDVSVERGDIELLPESLPLARIDAHTRSGDITLALPAGAKFDLTASTQSGQIQNTFGAVLNLQESGRGATLRGTNGGAAINLRTERGNIVVRTASPNEPALEPPITNGARRGKGLKELKGLKQLKRIEQ